MLYGVYHGREPLATPDRAALRLVAGGWLGLKTHRDEAVVAELRRGLRDGDAAGGAPAGKYAAGAYAAHALAAGVYEAISGDASPAQVMSRTIGVLAAMHDRNPSWERMLARGPSDTGGAGPGPGGDAPVGPGAPGLRRVPAGPAGAA